MASRPRADMLIFGLPFVPVAGLSFIDGKNSPETGATATFCRARFSDSNSLYEAPIFEACASQSPTWPRRSVIISGHDSGFRDCEPVKDAGLTTVPPFV